MRDQDVITRVVELHDHIHVPALDVGADAQRGTRLLRRRRATALTGVAATVVAAFALVQGASWDRDDAVRPVPAPVAPAPSGTADAGEARAAAFRAGLRTILERVPGWTVDDSQPSFTTTSCAGDWSAAAVGVGGGGFDVTTSGGPGQVWHQGIGFATPAAAVDARDVLVDNLVSCPGVVWHSDSVGDDGVVLASSGQGLIWIGRSGSGLSILEVPTPDGPPPPDVQDEVAELLSQLG